MEYLALAEYETIAKKIIYSYRNYRWLSNQYCKDEQFLGNVITAIIKADWTYDPDNVKGKTLQQYRTICALRCICSYCKKNKLRFTTYTDLEYTYNVFNAYKEKADSPDYSVLRNMIYNSGLNETEINILNMTADGAKVGEIALTLAMEPRKVTRAKTAAIHKIRRFTMSGV